MDNDGPQLIDELLVLNAQDGDRLAMDELIRMWHKRLWQHVYRLTMDRDTAWDISQEVWLAIIRGLARLEDPARFKPWAYRIATNKAADHIKSRQAVRSVEAHRRSEKPQPGPGNESLLSHLLDRLDPDKRAILALYYLDQLSVGEVSAVLSIPTGTVKSRLHSARKELKKLWLEENR